jgi:hypothetical protein
MDYVAARAKVNNPDTSDEGLKSVLDAIRDGEWTKDVRIDLLADVMIHLFDRLEALSKRTSV